MDRLPINIGLIANPWNWAIVLLMVWIIGLALSLLFQRNLLPTSAA
jgi:hypothetical protein